MSFKLSLSALQVLSVFDKKKMENAKVLAKALKLADVERDFVSRIFSSFELFDLALKVASDPQLKFSLALKIGDLTIASSLCEQIADPIAWKKLGDLAMIRGKFFIAKNAFKHCKDLNSLLLIGSSIGDVELLT